MHLQPCPRAQWASILLPVPRSGTGQTPKAFLKTDLGVIAGSWIPAQHFSFFIIFLACQICEGFHFLFCQAEFPSCLWLRSRTWVWQGIWEQSVWQPSLALEFPVCMNRTSSNLHPRQSVARERLILIGNVRWTLFYWLGGDGHLVLIRKLQKTPFTIISTQVNHRIKWSEMFHLVAESQLQAQQIYFTSVRHGLPSTKTNYCKIAIR